MYIGHDGAFSLPALWLVSACICCWVCVHLELGKQLDLERQLLPHTCY